MQEKVGALTRWTEQDLQTLKAKSRVIVHSSDLRSNTGTITSTEPKYKRKKRWVDPNRKAPLEAPGSAGSVKLGLGVIQVSQSALEAEFLTQVKSLKLPLPKQQYKPFTDRKFRLDFAYPDKKIAVMIQGNVHRIKEKFYRDCELFCLLTVAGWKFLPLTRIQVKSLEGVKWLKILLREGIQVI